MNRQQLGVACMIDPGDSGALRASAPLPPDNGLINGLGAYWKMNEPNAGQNRVDWTGNGNDAVDVTSSIGSAAGLIGLAAYNPNNGDSSQLLVTPTVNLASHDFSFSTWFKVSTFDTTNLFQMTDVGGIVICYAYLDPSGNLNVINDNGFIFSGPINLDQWYNVIVTQGQGSGAVRVYINGVQQAEQFLAVNNDITNLAFFNDVSGGSSANATMQQAGWWNRELVQADVTTLYNSGTPLIPEDFNGHGNISEINWTVEFLGVDGSFSGAGGVVTFGNISTGVSDYPTATSDILTPTKNYLASFHLTGSMTTLGGAVIGIALFNNGNPTDLFDLNTTDPSIDDHATYHLIAGHNYYFVVSWGTNTTGESINCALNITPSTQP